MQGRIIAIVGGIPRVGGGSLYGESLGASFGLGSPRGRG